MVENTRYIKEADLPDAVSAKDAILAAYPCELQQVQDALMRQLPVLIECEKGMVGYFYSVLRDQLKKSDVRCHFIDGRLPPDQQDNPMMQQGIMGTMVSQIRDIVRGATDDHDTEKKIVMVLPHIDLLTTSTGALTSEAKEVIPLLYENPNILWLGFRDFSFSLPKTITNLFTHKISIMGIPRDRVRHLVTKRESRKLGKDGLDAYRLYKNVSGIHAVKLRRILSSLDGEDYPEDGRHVWDQIRNATLSGELSVPEIDLHKDIGGYQRVKDKIQRDILDIISYKEGLEEPGEIARIEKLIPKGMLFWGPPGTGKTMFAKSIAAALGAAVQVVNGPELKSKWVGESEENLRQIFIKARQNAPSLIVFDELDSFAAARGTYTGSGVEHSMVNQLLTELDGFRDNEMVFVVGTSNFPESIDSALMRPGRLEFDLQIPFPNEDDRRAIFEIYNKKMGLKMTEKAFEHAVKLSGYPLDNGGRWSGDHIQALCRSVARRRIRNNIQGETDYLDLEKTQEEGDERPNFTKEEEIVIATHEAGHAIVAMHCEHIPPIDRISIRGDLAGALGFVSYTNPKNKYVATRKQMEDSVCTLFGGRAAEELLLDDISIGAENDIERATAIAGAMIERWGFGGTPRVYSTPNDQRHDGVSEDVKKALNHRIDEVVTREYERAATILKENCDSLEVLRDMLLEKKVLDSSSLSNLKK